MLLKVEFMPKFSVRGIWQRWRECQVNGNKTADAITVFTGVSWGLSKFVDLYNCQFSPNELFFHVQ